MSVVLSHKNQGRQKRVQHANRPAATLPVTVSGVTFAVSSTEASQATAKAATLQQQQMPHFLQHCCSSFWRTFISVVAIFAILEIQISA
jgi:hypothetical protein